MRAGISKYLGILLILSCVWLYSDIHAQSYQIKNYTQEDGLPNPVVYSIAQDQMGRMWFATRAGISVYDGYTWTNYSLENGLRVKEYIQIQFDSKNILWGIPKGQYNHLITFKDGKWSLIRFDTGMIEVKPNVRCFAVINDGTPVVAIGTAHRGIYLYTNGKWTHLSAEDGLEAESIYSLKSFEGIFYAATNKGLFQFDKYGRNIKHISDSVKLPSESIYNIAVERFGRGPDSLRIWTLDESHLGYIQNKKYFLETSGFGLKYFFINTYRFPLVINYFDTIIFGNQDKLFFFNRKSRELKLTNTDNGLLGTTANAVFLDRENLLWFAGNRGVSKLQSMKFQNFKKTNGLLMDEVTSVLEYSKGKFIFGHNRGLSFYDGKTFSGIEFVPEQTAGIPSARVMSLAKDSTGNIWIAADMYGLGKMDKNRNITWYNRSNDGFGESRSVETDRDGVVWSLSQSGLKFFDNGIFKTYPLNYDLAAFFRKLEFSPSWDMYLLTTNNGLFLRTGEGIFKNICSRANRNFNNVFSMGFISKDTILVGTEVGLCWIKGDSLVKFNSDKLKIDYPIYFIRKDNAGNLWFGTDRGATKWDGKTRTDYDVKRGLSGLEANRAAGYADSEGNFWIGTDRGLSEYVPQYDRKQEFNPIILVDSIKGTKSSFPALQQSKIPFSENNITFTIKVISFIDEEEDIVYARLNGYDESWQQIKLHSSSPFRYTNLPPGTYQLSIKVENINGEMSKTIRMPEFSILKPFYQEWWFYFILALGITFTGYWIINSYNRMKYTVKLEQDVRERTALLYESEKRYHQMFEENQAIMFLIESETGKIIDTNKAASEYYGFKFSEMIGMEISEIDDSFKPGEIAAKMNEILISKKPIISLHHLADGRNRFVEIYCSLLEQQNKELYYIIVHDVTDRMTAEESLAESEEKYRSLVDYMVDGVFMIQDEKFIFANSSFHRILGAAENEIIGHRFQEFIDPEDVMMIENNYKRRNAGENIPNNYELRAIHRITHARVFLLLSVSLVNLEGKLTTIGTIKDITLNKEREDKLRQLSTAVEQSPVGIFITDPDGNIIYINPKFSSDTGYAESEILGKNIRLLDSGIHSSGHFENLWATIKSGNIWKGEFFNKRKDETLYWVSSNVSPIIDDSGKIESFIAFQEDITFQKYAAEEIRKSEDLLNSVLNHSPIITFALDLSGIFTLSKGKELKSINLEQDEIVGKSVFDVFGEYPSIISDVRRALDGETFTSVTFIMNLVFETLYSPIYDGFSTFVGVLGVSSNITERFEAEKKLIAAKEAAERSDTLKSAFLAQMSHEIRTPVNTILSFTSLLKEEVKSKVSDELIHVFDFIDSGGRRLIRTIDLILDMSQFQTGTYVPSFSKVDLNKEVLTNVVTELKSLAERKNLELEFTTENGQASTIGDPYTIGQIFINLIDNAIKYTHYGKISIKIYDKDERICVEVKDTGIGISKEYLSAMFTPFSQEETGYTRRFEGTGLGLALVKKYVEINDASIAVESEKGVGTTFTVSFQRAAKS